MLALITGMFVTNTYRSAVPAKLSEVLNVPLEPDTSVPVPKISATSVLALSALEASDPVAVMLAATSTGKLASAYRVPVPTITAAPSFIRTAADIRLPAPAMLPDTL